MNRYLIVLLALSFLFFGCSGPAAPIEQANVTVEEQQSVSAEENSNGEELEVTENKVLILGRSVAYGWMEYLGFEWTCDDEECYTGSPRGTYEDYYFIYYELDYPPEIADSAIEGVDTYGTDAEVIFFKFCFVDFTADDETIQLNEQLVEDVYQGVVVEHNKKLIVGNALPMVAQDTEPALVTNHRNYNQWLDNFAATHDNVEVLDLYGILSDSNGNLRSDYALATDDSHLNDVAYAEITSQFMDLLG
ncbi:hypothetical protein KKB44_01550 [Candidatus Micrarchaeota archaeon]|nr:hypothetical protein [Candidatus Micrarchaeota archaeon]